MKKYNVEVKTSGDFEDDPEAALDALEKTGFAVFMISKQWYCDMRAQKEWRFAKDLKKPMVYIVAESGRADFRENMFTDSLIGIINHYGDMKQTGNYLQAIIAAFKQNLEES